MEPHDGYFCRAYVGQDVQANVIARTLREAEQEITRMIRGGAMTAHAVRFEDAMTALKQRILWCPLFACPQFGSVRQ